jgi:hypothetical protein
MDFRRTRAQIESSINEPSPRPGHAAISDARALAPGDPGWARFTRDVLDLPLWMVPAVQVAIRQASWKQALNPLETVRENAHRVAIRMDLKPETTKGD